MTQPRMALPGTTYQVTRSCAERRFYLRPDPKINDAFAFCLARARQFHSDIEVHAVSVQSNHYHAVVTDMRGGTALSDFMHALNMLLGRFLQKHLTDDTSGKTLERVWGRRSFSAVALLTEEAVLNAVAYTLINPVRHALVADYRKWPGFNTRPAHWNMPERLAARPELYFDQSDEKLRELPLKLTPPPALSRGRTLEEVTRYVDDCVLSEQRIMVGTHAANGDRILGVKLVLSTDPFDQPGEPRKKSDLNPHLAAGGDQEAMLRGKKLLGEFRAAYREAWKAFKRCEVIAFPYGTVLMVHRYHVTVAAAFVAPWCAQAGFT